MALILVTGASTGLGLATARTLIDQGHQVVVHALSARRLDDVDLSGNRGIVLGDLTNAEETRRVAEQANGFGRFDAVIHNAGVLGSPDVYEVNVVAPYLLTALMRPPARSIVLSSSMHRSGKPDPGVLGSPGAGQRPRAYDTTKLLVTVFAMAMAQRRPDQLWHAVDPGWVPTRMGGPGASDDLDEGHRTQEWLATADEIAISPRSRAGRPGGSPRSTQRTAERNRSDRCCAGSHRTRGRFVGVVISEVRRVS